MKVWLALLLAGTACGGGAAVPDDEVAGPSASSIGTNAPSAVETTLAPAATTTTAAPTTTTATNTTAAPTTTTATKTTTAPTTTAQIPDEPLYEEAWDNPPKEQPEDSGPSEKPAGWNPSVLSNTPGPVTQCLDSRIGGSRVMALARSEAWPSHQELEIVGGCLDLDAGGSSDRTGPEDDRGPADEPEPDPENPPPPPDDNWPCLGDPIPMTYVDLGWPITYETPGLPSGLTPLVDGMDQGIKFIADPTSMLLSDGHVRLFFEGDGDKSWRSTTPAQSPYRTLDFEPEAGYQLLGNDGRPRHDLAWRRIFPLPDGRTRMFARTTSTIFSFLSDNGLRFTQEPGTRLTLADVGLTTFRGFEVGFAGYDIVATDDGWRMYVDYQLGFGPNGSSPSNEDRDDFTSRIHSASSIDMLTWIVDPGERVGSSSGVRGFSDADRDRGDGGPLRTAARISLSSVERRPSGDYLLSFTLGDDSCVVGSTDGLLFDEWASPTDEGFGHQDKLDLGDGDLLVFGTASGTGIPMGHLRLD